MIASKYQEVYNPLSPVECRYLCDDTFTVEEVGLTLLALSSPLPTPFPPILFGR